MLLLCLSACGRFGFGNDPIADGPAMGASDANDSGIDTMLDPYAAAVLADAPIGYWRLGEASGAIADSSGHQYSGTVTGGVTLARPGLYASPDTAAGFDGATGYIWVGDDPLLRVSSQISLEAWINAASFDHAAAGQFPRVVHKGSIGNTGYALMAYQIGTTNTANIRIELEGLTQPGVTGATTLMPNTTYHVVGSWDGSAIKVYVNGTIDGTVAATGAIPMTNDLLDIGRRPDSQRYWAGVLDDVAVYDHALTPTRIAAHYAAGQ